MAKRWSTGRPRWTSPAARSCARASAVSRAWCWAARSLAGLVAAAIATAVTAPAAPAAELDAELRAELASPYREARQAGEAVLAKRATETPGLLKECLAVPEPATRRAAARLLASRPDPALAGPLGEAFLAENDAVVREALAVALAAQPEALAALAERVAAAHSPALSGAFERAAEIAVATRLAGKVREGRVPGFYDGQFSDLWKIDAQAAERLIAFAHDDALHHVFRVVATMALAETRRPTLERDLSGLVLDERLELDAAHDSMFDRHIGAAEIERYRSYDLSRYARFSLAKAGITAPILRLIAVIDSVLANGSVKAMIAQSVTPDSNAYWEVEYLRGLLFESGYYFQQFDDYANAEKRYRKLIHDFPSSSSCKNAYYNLACICAIQGRRPEAFDALRKAIRAGFTDANWLLEDGDLTSLRGDPEFNSLVEEARTGIRDDSGRQWATRLQPFLPAGTKSFYDLSPDLQAAVWTVAGKKLTPAEAQRLVDDAPPPDRDRLRALVLGGGR
jgi:tetratricopeptide (TPR) repeat protein